MNLIFTRAIKISLAMSVSLLFLLLMLFSSVLGAGQTLPNGVAAGDVSQTSAVLWAHSSVVGDISFVYATDPTLATNLFTVTTIVVDPLQPVKVELTNLTPATAYFYRITDAADTTAEGQFRTSAPLGTQAGLRFGVSGDWREALAPYPSIANVPQRDLDFFIAHGDTIEATDALSLDDFRLKHQAVYATYFGLNHWAALRASTSLLATIDDNEVRNDFAGGAAPASDPRFDNTGVFINETMLYQNAVQAFQEYNPLHDRLYEVTADPRTANKRKLYRFKTYGNDAAIFILDTRSFRDEQLEALADLTDSAAVLDFLTTSLSDTTRTILGQQQLADLKADLQQAQAEGITWKFVLTPSPIQNLGPFKAEDRLEGYGAERTDLLRYIDQQPIENVVFIAAGLHGTLVNNLTYQTVSPTMTLTLPLEQVPTGAFEVIVGPVAISPPEGPFGPAIVQIAVEAGLISPAQQALYESLPRSLKDELIRMTLNDQLLAPLGFDPLGLAAADSGSASGIEATLLQGGYLSAHTYGWTEFEIEASTQVLTVTTYGIDYYTEEELAGDPTSILARTPAVVSQFTVVPKAGEHIYLPTILKQ